MSNYGKHSNQGGGGIRRPGGNAQRNQNRNYNSSRDKQTQDADTVDKYWPNYLKGGYFDENGCLKIEYVSRENVEPLVKNMGADYNGKSKLTTSQLRRFFQHCKRIQAKIKSGRSQWPNIHPEFMVLDLAASDAFGKKPRKIPELFYNFIKRNTAVVKTERDFNDGFMPHFEALVGFGSGHLRERN